MPLNNHPTGNRPTTSTTPSPRAAPRSPTACCSPPSTTLRTAGIHRKPPIDHPGSSLDVARQPIANYLVENSVGNYDKLRRLPRRLKTASAYYEASQRHDREREAANMAIMDQQQDITDFQSLFNGPFPFTSDGVLVGTPKPGSRRRCRPRSRSRVVDRPRHVQPREHAPVVGRQRRRGH